MLYRLGDNSPSVGKDCFVAPSADVIGQVVLEDACSIWFNAVLRGDNEPITIGKRSNIQDGSVVHVDAGFPVLVEEEVTVGHKVMLHGCTVKKGALVGINAVVLNGAVVGENSLVGANALVTEGMEIPPNSLVLGSPGKVVKEVGPKVIEAVRLGMLHYVEKAVAYGEELVALE